MAFHMEYEKITKRRYATGFTLLEFIIYLGIVSIVLLVSTAIYLNIVLAKAKLTAMAEVSNGARFVMERISENIRNANAILSPASGSSASILSLEMSDPARNPTVYDLSQGAIRIKEGSGPTVNLTPASLVTANLIFTNTSYTNTPGTMRIQINLKYYNPDESPEYDFERIFFTSSNIRLK